MTTIGIYGASDDLTEIEVDGKPFEEFGEPRSFVFSSEGKSLTVDIEHDGKRGWLLTTCIDDESEDGDLPFRVAIVQEKYSPKLEVTVTGAPVTFTWWEDKKPRTKTFAAKLGGA